MPKMVKIDLESTFCELFQENMLKTTNSWFIFMGKLASAIWFTYYIMTL